MIKVAITTEQFIDVPLKITSAGGKPAPIDGEPQWTIESGIDIISVTTSPKGLVGRIYPDSDQTGVAVVRVSVDADVGEGTETISEDIEVTVTSPKAANLGIKPLVPQLIPADGDVGEPSDPV